MKLRTEVTPKPAMNPIDLRTELEEIQALLRRATADDEVRRLNARKRRVEKKLLKVYRREVRENDGLGTKWDARNEADAPKEPPHD